jgi:hypothetical protein
MGSSSAHDGVRDAGALDSLLAALLPEQHLPRRPGALLGMRSTMCTAAPAPCQATRERIPAGLKSSASALSGMRSTAHAAAQAPCTLHRSKLQLNLERCGTAALTPMWPGVRGARTPHRALSGKNGSSAPMLLTSTTRFTRPCRCAAVTRLATPCRRSRDAMSGSGQKPQRALAAHRSCVCA